MPRDLMDGVTLQSKVYLGYAKSAQRIGLPFNQYRPADPLNPVATIRQSLPCHLRVDDKFARPNVYGKALWLAYVDGSQLAVGDYLEGPTQTVFVAAMQPLLPILCVECNRVVTISRVAIPTDIGPLPYNGDVADTETVMMQGWPASILAGPKGEKNEVGLPGDVRQAWWVCLLPSWPGIVIEASDIVTDDLGRRYITSSCELTDLGWRLTLQQAVT